MCGYNILESSVSLTLADTPVGYSPPIGPSAKVRVSYNQRESTQPANFDFFNVSPKWTLNWLTYVTDDPTNPGGDVSRYLAGGGTLYYSGYDSTTGQFTGQVTDGSILTLASQSPIEYRRFLRNGAIEVYAQSDGSVSYPRNIFLSQVIDPQGNSVTLTYDDQQRLISLTDAVGRQTTFTYGLSTRPLLVTQITDPFGRSATLAYDAAGRLISITDVLGITSSFSYDANSLVNSLTTPYGTTNFTYTAPGTTGPPLFAQATDPLGYNEREEWLEPAPVPDSDPSDTIPQGMPLTPTNQYLEYRDSFHWDKNAYIVAGCTPSGGCDYTKAREKHFNHYASNIKGTSIESIKYPLENRIWYNYPGQTSSILMGTSMRPTAMGRVLDDGTTQLSQFSYDSTSFFNLTQTTDPLGRITQYTYAPNHIDLLAITQSAGNNMLTPIRQFAYNLQHRPIAITDAAGQTTTYTYNAQGQLISVTNSLQQTTQYQYDSTNNLASIVNANGQTAASFTYDTFDRVATYTDSEGWTVSFSYDNGDRITKITYPDGTSDIYTYDNLDLAQFEDRQYRVWTYTHDADRRLTKIVDPLGHQTLFGYNPINELTSLTDPNGNTTTWTYDVEGRLTSKQYADTSTVAYAYESTTSRLHSITDALNQIKQFGYSEDNRLSAISYVNAVNPTSNVSFTYDPFFPRVTSMTDGTGTTQYSYVPSFSLGALGPQQECFTAIGGNSCSYQISYAYDSLGRLASRIISGAGAETFGYDALGNLTSHNSDLGSFTLSYLGQTGQITSRQLANSTLSTSWGYLPNSGDRRLASIDNTGLSADQFSNFAFTTTPEYLIAAITENSDAATVYPTTSALTATYNSLNQLTNLSGQTLTYDADGNLLSDGQHNYSWDAENRLIAITYPAEPGKQTGFTYDGLGRRTAISSVPTGGGTAVVTTYVWCSSRLCQARNSGNAVVREYYAEGELLQGTPAQPYFYGIDQIASVRRIFASTSSAPAFAFEPYGVPLQVSTPPTSRAYAGMFLSPDSGLYLTHFRPYSPSNGQWLSRDLIGGRSDHAVNLYQYVNAEPISRRDPLGLDPIQVQPLLPPPTPNIPGTNIPDLGRPEDATPGRTFDPNTQTGDQSILLPPPNPGMDVPMAIYPPLLNVPLPSLDQPIGGPPLPPLPQPPPPGCLG